MSFDWREMFKVANFLETEGNKKLKSKAAKEALHRSAINRSYYSAYNYTLEIAESRFAYTKLTGKKLGANHTKLIKHLQTCNIDKRLKTIGLLLNSVKRARHRADYDATPPISSKDSRLASINTQQIFNLIKRI